MSDAELNVLSSAIERVVGAEGAVIGKKMVEADAASSEGVVGDNEAGLKPDAASSECVGVGDNEAALKPDAASSEDVVGDNEAGLKTPPQKKSGLDVGRPLSMQKTIANKPTNGFRIVQWNQKDLTLLNVDNPNYARSMSRIKNIVSDLTDLNTFGHNGIAACVFEEVVGGRGGGGESAVRKIVEDMNNSIENKPYEYIMSGVVNPLKVHNREQYAVIYNKVLLGNCTVDSAWLPSLAQFNPAQPDLVSVGAVEINLSRARQIYEQVALDGGLNDRFDRLPALFSFSGPSDNSFGGNNLHFIAVHSSTGQENKKPHQNMVETVFLQEICWQAAEQGEYCVLLGDFNHDEVSNSTDFMWDATSELYPLNDTRNISEVDERDLFSHTRENFLSYYMRACDKLLPTNVYPFLSGGEATGKHNDDIWLPKLENQPVNSTGKQVINVKELFGGANDGPAVMFKISSLGVVHTIPPRITLQWDNDAQEFYKQSPIGARYQSRLNRGARTSLNLLLAKSWSDHRPLSVQLKLTRSQNVAEQKENTAEDEDEVSSKMHNLTRYFAKSSID